MSERTALVVTHTGRPGAVTAAVDVVRALHDAGMTALLLPEEAEAVAAGGATGHRVAAVESPVDGAEIAVVVGGDGTILRGAELVRGTPVPLLGVNLGHVGFLAEAEREDVPTMVARLAARDYAVEERMAVQVDVRLGDAVVASSWALNEVSVEKASRERMVEVAVEVDGRPLSTFGCDGIVAATPTGSTAYAFSAGGPVVWPEVEALLLVPLSAHALFARPLVVAPTSVLAVELVQGAEGRGVLWCDGRRTVPLEPGSRIEVRRSPDAVRLARLAPGPFTDRLVAKFRLPVDGWRGPRTRQLGRLQPGRP